MLLTNNYYHITNKVYKCISEGNLSSRNTARRSAAGLTKPVENFATFQNARSSTHGRQVSSDQHDVYRFIIKSFFQLTRDTSRCFDEKNKGLR